MNRREFLKNTAAVAAVGLIPLTPKDEIEIFSVHHRWLGFSDFTVSRMDKNGKMHQIADTSVIDELNRLPKIEYQPGKQTLIWFAKVNGKIQLPVQVRHA